MKQRIYIYTSIVGGFFDKEFADVELTPEAENLAIATMKTDEIEKDFDCVKMKNDIQAKIYAEIKDMSSSERVEYFKDGTQAFWSTLKEKKISFLGLYAKLKLSKM